MIEAIRDFAEALPEVVQWLILLVIGAVPYVEAYGAAFLGVIAGINPAIALVAGVIGNVVSMLLAMKLGRSLDRWGIAVVALIGPTILPSQVTAAGLVGFGADRRRVIAWSIAGILLWAVVFLGLGLLVNRFLG